MRVGTVGWFELEGREEKGCKILNFPENSKQHVVQMLFRGTALLRLPDESGLYIEVVLGKLEECRIWK